MGLKMESWKEEIKYRLGRRKVNLLKAKVKRRKKDIEQLKQRQLSHKRNVAEKRRQLKEIKLETKIMKEHDKQRKMGGGSGLGGNAMSMNPDAMPGGFNTIPGQPKKKKKKKGKGKIKKVIYYR